MMTDMANTTSPPISVSTFLLFLLALVATGCIQSGAAWKASTVDSATLAGHIQSAGTQFLGRSINMTLEKSPYAADQSYYTYLDAMNNKLRLDLLVILVTNAQDAQARLHPDWYGAHRTVRMGKTMYVSKTPGHLEVRMLCDSAHYEVTADIYTTDLETQGIRDKTDQLVNDLVKACPE